MLRLAHWYTALCRSNRNIVTSALVKIPKLAAYLPEVKSEPNGLVKQDRLLSPIDFNLLATTLHWPILDFQDLSGSRKGLFMVPLCLLNSSFRSKQSVHVGPEPTDASVCRSHRRRQVLVRLNGDDVDALSFFALRDRASEARREGFGLEQPRMQRCRCTLGETSGTSEQAGRLVCGISKLQVCMVEAK